MNWEMILQIILGVCGGGGLIVGIVALLKVRPEAGQIVVTAAEGAVIVQSKVIEQLRTEIERLRQENESLRLEIKLLRQQLELISKNIHK